MITKIYKSIFTLCVMCLLCGISVSCSSDEDPFFTAGENDAPRILNTDIPEGKDGEPGVIKTIVRTENFTFEVMVTPVHQTTVTWFIDGEQVAEGLSIDVPVKTGNHTLKIVATTTSGKTTSRTCTIVVQPAADDPVPAGDIYERLVKQGSKAKLHGTFMSKVTKVIIGETTVEATYNADDDCVEYTVPELPDGTYQLMVGDAEGNIFGGGQIELNANPQYPVVGEKTLWEGEFNVTWGTPFDGLKETILDLVGAGDVLHVYVTGNGQGCAATSWWRNILTGVSEDDEPGGRGDVKIEGDMTLDYVLTEKSIQLLTEQDGMLIVGDGYTVLKITIDQTTQSSETTLWEGEASVTWDKPFDALKETILDYVSAGQTLRVYVEGDGQGCAATSWWRNILNGVSEDDVPGGRGDFIISGEQVLEYELTDKSIELLTEQDGMLVVGNGFTVKKITVQ